MIVLYILIAIIILLVMIVIHELGHYVAGKILKFRINEFSVGFGPKLLQRRNKRTGELFTLRLIPLGGYCAFEDESGLESESGDKDKTEPASAELFPEIAPAPQVNAGSAAAEVKTAGTPAVSTESDAQEGARPRSFVEEAPWKRIIVLISGALFNFVSAIIFSFIFIAAVGYAVPEVAELYENDEGAPYAAQLEKGDRILAVDGDRLGIMLSFDEAASRYGEGAEVPLTVLRGGEEIVVSVKVQRIVNTERELDYIGMGFTPINAAVNAGPLYALQYCVPYACKLAWVILGSFGQLITGRLPITSMSGPVGTVGLMAQLGMADPRNFLVLLPLIAANLAIFNILPIPALDGSKVVFTVIEWVRGKPVNRKVENIIHTVGLFALLGLVVLVDLLGVIL